MRRLAVASAVPGSVVAARWMSIVFLALGLSVPADAAADNSLQLEDVFAIQYANSPLVAPDGERIYYLRNSMDILKDKRRSNLWMIGSDGRDHRPLTTGPRNISSPTLSPDGSRIAYVDRDDVAAQIFVHWIDGGSTAQLTRGGESPRSLSWSPDGRWLAFAMRVAVDAPTMGSLPKPPKGAEWAPPPTVVDRVVYRNDGSGVRPEAFYQLFVIPADGGARASLREGPYDHERPPRPGPRIRKLYLLGQSRRGSRPRMWSIRSFIALKIASGRSTQLTDRPGRTGLAGVSPDGKQLAYLGWDDRGMSYHRTRLYRHERPWLESQRAAAGPRPQRGEPALVRGRRAPVFPFDDRGDTVLASTLASTATCSALPGVSGGTSLGRPYSGAAYDARRGRSLRLHHGQHLAARGRGTGPGGTEPRRLTFAQ
jgi:Tol biopolymer transport system component